MSAWKDVFGLFHQLSQPSGSFAGMSPGQVEENNRLSKAIGEALEREAGLQPHTPIPTDMPLTPEAEERFGEWKAWLKKESIAV